jgi:hypothetical protein
MLSQRKIDRVSAGLLLAGLASAVLLYAFAEPEGPGNPWQTDPLGQRRYTRQMQVIGGKTNLLSAEFMDWFAARWHGRNLACTVAVLTVAATGGYRFVAGRRLLHAVMAERDTPPEIVNGR